jgi:hypothetical protein
VFRYTTAVHLSEAGVEINVIRSWLGHVSLDTTNRCAEITTCAKEAALRVCEPPPAASAVLLAQPVWRTDESLLAWLNSLWQLCGQNPAPHPVRRFVAARRPHNDGGHIAYNLGNRLRPLVLPLAIQSWSLTSLQQRLFKAGGRLIRHARYLTLQLAESYLTLTLLREILGRIERLAWHPT